MKTHLITGACGFVGRYMTMRLLKDTSNKLILIDDLSTGIDPSFWLPLPLNNVPKQEYVFNNDGRILFIKKDLRVALRYLEKNHRAISNSFGFDISKISSVFHFAAIVQGREKIDGSPMHVALNLSIDSEFFHWVCLRQPHKVLYVSSSAVYPLHLQQDTKANALTESDINFQNLGQPDMTYGWSKLTGEYLAHIVAKHHNISVACVRPFSGYGVGQDNVYPIPSIVDRIIRKEDPVIVWGSGEQSRDFVYIEDFIDGCLLAIKNISDGRAINIGSGNPTTFKDVINILAKIAGYKPLIKPLLDKPVGVQKRYANIHMAKKLLGWQPKIPLKEGLNKVYQHALGKFRKH
ncbi:MAG: NAD-dependent epimerase/dehydratase family protein [Bacteroidota bacterium]